MGVMIVAMRAAVPLCHPASTRHALLSGWLAARALPPLLPSARRHRVHLPRPAPPPVPQARLPSCARRHRVHRLLWPPGRREGAEQLLWAQVWTGGGKGACAALEGGRHRTCFVGISIKVFWCLDTLLLSAKGGDCAWLHTERSVLHCDSSLSLSRCALSLSTYLHPHHPRCAVQCTHIPSMMPSTAAANTPTSQRVLSSLPPAPLLTCCFTITQIVIQLFLLHVLCMCAVTPSPRRALARVSWWKTRPTSR